MKETLFSKSHEWIRVEGPEGTVGVTEILVKRMDQVLALCLPAIGDVCSVGKNVGFIRTPNARYEIYAPMSGTVLEVNRALEMDLAPLREDPRTDGWLFRMRIADPFETQALVDETAYYRYALECE